MLLLHSAPPEGPILNDSFAWSGLVIDLDEAIVCNV
jgi:hypothetical protein